LNKIEVRFVADIFSGDLMGDLRFHFCLICRMRFASDACNLCAAIHKATPFPIASATPCSATEWNAFIFCKPFLRGTQSKEAQVRKAEREQGRQ
jgi:hypothetical protein